MSNSSSANAVRRLVDPLKDFLHTEAAGGLALLAATVVALGWPTGPLGAGYEGLWVWELTIGAGPLSVTEGPPALGHRRSHGRVLLRGRPGDQLVIPLFALANAGMPMGGGGRGRAAHNPVAWDVALGLLAGKNLGVAGTSLVAVRLRLGSLPGDLTMRHVLGLGAGRDRLHGVAVHRRARPYRQRAG